MALLLLDRVGIRRFNPHDTKRIRNAPVSVDSCHTQRHYAALFGQYQILISADYLGRMMVYDLPYWLRLGYMLWQVDPIWQ